MKHCLKLVPAVLLMMSLPVTATVSEDAFLQRLIGVWKGEGKVIGLASRVTMQWEWSLGQRFARLMWRNEMQSKNNERQLFEGHAYYQPVAPGQYKANWFDSGGEAHPIQAAVENDALTANWGTKETKEGRTIYRFTAPDRLEVTDLIRLKDGSWKEFGRTNFVRESKP